MKKPHKHAEVIKAWADGHIVQLKRTDGPWVDLDVASDRQCIHAFDSNFEYRIKPVQTDLEIYGVEVGDIWKILPSDTVIAVRYVRNINVMSLTGIDHNFASLNLLLFRRGVVDKL